MANIPQPQLPEISATGNIPVATTRPGEIQISQSNNPGTISAPENPNRPKPFAKVQSEVQGLVVSRLDNGDMAGQTLDIIATVSPSGNPNDPAAFVGSAIGPEMRTSLQEAIRAIQVRYPTWGNGTIQISFGDEYSQKDGGSAGAAFALLFLSELENFDIDNQFAITGEITTDWKFRPVGGVAAKIQGAVDNGCKAVILPEANLQQVQDAILLNGQDTAWKIQIFTEPDLQHAEALIRSDRAKNLQQAIDLFSKVQDEFGNKGDAALYDPQVIGELKQVLALAPEMESAQYLLEESQGKEPRNLSDFASEYEAIVHIYPIQDLIFSDKNVVINRTTLPSLVVDKMRRNLGQLRDISPDDTVPLI
ncbi:MAG TPA: S16 family serine protease, partial [Phycisphaerae bacterium]|nr:S16 family serine protease [Phycisphaerae bacterium]